MRRYLASLALTALVGCVALPDVPVPERDVNADTDYPDLVNLRTLELTAAEDQAEAVETEETTEARVANLRSRADELRRAEFE